MSLAKDVFGFMRSSRFKLTRSEDVIIRDGRVLHPDELDHSTPNPSPVDQKIPLISDTLVVSSGSEAPLSEAAPIVVPSSPDGKEMSAEVKQGDRKIPGSELLADEDELPQKEAKKGRLPKIERFWDHLDVAGRGKRTIQEYKYEWKWWEAEALKKKRTVYSLRVKDIEEILKGLNPSTNRRKIAFLRTLSKWYLREGHPLLHTEIWKITSPKIPKRLPKDRGSEEFEELREKAKKLIADKDRVGLWIGLKLLCGLRISEIQTARKAGPGKIQVSGKGQKERLVPAPDWVLKGMKAIPADGKGGWRQGRIVIWRALAKEGIRKPHSLRHTYASELKRRGKTLDEIQVLLGHSDISTTTIYARIDIPDGVAELLDS
jgi:site-specific recombinase XerD